MLDKLDCSFPQTEHILILLGYHNKDQSCASTIIPHVTALITALTTTFPNGKICFCKVPISNKLPAQVKCNLDNLNMYFEKKLNTKHLFLNLNIDSTLLNSKFLTNDSCTLILESWTNF